MKYKQILRKLTQEEKDEFFLQALNTSSALKKKFEKEFASRLHIKDTETGYEHFCELADKEKQKWIGEFENLDLDVSDWEYRMPRYGRYISWDEAAEMVAEQEVASLFDPWKEQLVEDLSARNINSFFASVVGIYEACYLADIRDDDYVLCGEPNNYLLGSFEEVLQQISEKPSLTRIDPAVMEEPLTNACHYIAEKGISKGQLTCQLDDLMKNLGRNPSFIPVLSTALLQIPDAGPLFPKTAILIAKSGDPDTWTEQAEKLFRINKEVAGDLMSYYLRQNRYDDFHRIAVECYTQDKYAFAEFVIENMKDEYDPEFTKRVLLSRASYLNDISLYQRAKRWMTENERIEFRNENNHAQVFYGRLLAEEKEYGQLFYMLENDNLMSFNTFGELLIIATRVMPDKCFDLVLKKVSFILERQRDRHIYQHIAGWLRTIHNTENKERLAGYITSLYNHTPILRALRDELRKAGLVG